MYLNEKLWSCSINRLLKIRSVFSEPFPVTWLLSMILFLINRGFTYKLFYMSLELFTNLCICNILRQCFLTGVPPGESKRVAKVLILNVRNLLTLYLQKGIDIILIFFFIVCHKVWKILIVCRHNKKVEKHCFNCFKI
jgi:hypothetical protein